MANLKPIDKTCTPRDDVLAGALSDEHFAADLDHFVRDPGSYPVYSDADEFFALTHPTKGLRDLLTRTFGRISGATGVARTEKGVLRPQTSFGGGKTHGLIALYHLAKGARPPGLDRFVDPRALSGQSRRQAVNLRARPRQGKPGTIGRRGSSSEDPEVADGPIRSSVGGTSASFPQTTGGWMNCSSSPRPCSGRQSGLCVV